MSRRYKFGTSLNIEELLLSKQLEPLTEHSKQALQKITNLDVAGFSEAEVRAYVIDPIVEILGYEKGTKFQAKLEHGIKILNTSIFPDYQISLWEENFWIIEAKKPQLNKSEFESSDLRQAIEYSVHPSINAALVVLCDGFKFEIFDREVNVEAPLLRIRIGNLATEFDKIRSILEPMQAWFFQKRRVVRLIDKVFDKEFNMERVEEFKNLIDGRLQRKQQTVLENFRKTPKHDENEETALIAGASAIDLVEMNFFFETNVSATKAIIKRLVDLSFPDSFGVMLRIFPDAPRDVSDTYMGYALAYLMKLGMQTSQARWMPSWLNSESSDRQSIEQAIRYLLRQCLSYFESHEAYRTILLAANAYRRLSKIFSIVSDEVRTTGIEMHAISRYLLPEMSWKQILASPEKQIIANIDAATMMATKAFVHKNSGENYTFKIESARHDLRQLWQVELGLLRSIGNYAKLSRERSLGELRVIEPSGVTYDSLGHFTLCLMEYFPEWKRFVLMEHLAQVRKLAAMGSWSARKLLDIPPGTDIAPLDDIDISNRFFLGDVGTLQSLREMYQVGT
ncbi:MAG: hypothetical protein EWV63_13995 [Microcystis aeruginosa Ma_OC_H_19870700_S124]|uniref:Uncharacterized protein n=1 Tax=Microcystis aeruginosa Ma_OC_H_19870700_S124 TaxID=2486262 RepID=A0A552AHV6_MICAE|nr:MAG: hypothetical protein EWV63_13995 [Microcystis aeruginosa Ma_OC_H_19870700_S124]